MIAIAAVYFNFRFRAGYGGSFADRLQPENRPLPVLTSPKKRLDSYTPQRGDIKYRVVPKPVISTDPNSNWSLYTSRDYGFSFIFPPNTAIESTESLGYQLPPNLAFKGSRDNFEIKMSNKSGAYFLFFLNYPNFKVENTTTTAQTIFTIAGAKGNKIIMQSTDPKYASSQIIMFNFEKNGKSFIWYGAFDSQDYESINNFQSIVDSTKFN